MLKLVAFLGLMGLMSCAWEPTPEPPGPARSGAAPEPPDNAPTQWPSTDGPIAWSSWSAETWRRAQERDLPVLLYLATPGGDGTFATGGAALQLMVEEEFTAIREDPHHRPDLARRYGAGGWPTLALFLPDGRLFAKAVDVPADNARMYLWRLRGDYEKWREQIVAKVERAQAEAVKPPTYKLDIDAVFRAAAATYDEALGGFGAVRKFPEPAVLDFLLEYAGHKAEVAAGRMVYQTLDHLLASPMVAEGGIAAFSHTPDWRTPAEEFDAADQAGILRVLLTAAAAGEARFEAPARALIGYIGRHLYRPGDGYFRGRRLGYRTASGEKVWWADPVPYADRNALLISACLAAAARLSDAAAREMAMNAGTYLLDRCIGEDGRVRHTCGDIGGALSGLLVDQVLVTESLLDLFAASGVERYREAAGRTLAYAEENNYDAEQRMFVEHSPTIVGANSLASYRDDLLPAGNGLAAALYVKTGNLDRAAALLDGPRLRTAGDRSHATTARALIRYRRAIAPGPEQVK